MTTEARALGYTAADVGRIEALVGAPLSALKSPEDLRRAIDAIDGERNGAAGVLRSVRAALHATRIGLIDGALLAYGLLELTFPPTPRRLLTISLRDAGGDERLHVATLWWNERGRVGAFAKSRSPGMGHRTAVFAGAMSIAASFARAIGAAGGKPVSYGLVRMEELAGDLDWRDSGAGLEVLVSRLASECVYPFDEADAYAS